ncbi:MAG: threonine synthase, partial [Enterococcus faecalis]|nr:threonine synthase [Enterococcus faecalis]
MYEGLLKQYQAYLPVTEKTPMISLAEGNTPLIPLPNLSKELGIQLYGKYEG